MGIKDFLSSLAGGAKTREALLALVTSAKDERKQYFDEIKKAQKDTDIFKYLLLIDSSSLDEYVAQTRLQAQESFILSSAVAVVGFCLIVAGVIAGIYASIYSKPLIDASYLSSLSGILTEFISGIFFYLYNKTLQQLNLFGDKLLTSKQTVMSLLESSLISDNKKDEVKADLAKLLISGPLK